ncbi:MAG TPA: adenylate/guanylate cyclase domain-containing protein [Burkholderiales bacterium]|nr:adenylate/guanylate cyclase domain-containing protein [Burkholderiales bacterium]
MNQTAIYSKTGKGVQEASGKTSILSRAERAVLAAIDGKTTVGELNIKFDKISEANFFALVEKLEREGFVREASVGVATKPPPPPARPAAPPPGPPSVPPAAGGDDLDFTQVLPGAPASKPSVDLAAKARAEAERKAQEDSLGFRAREAAEAKAKAEADARAKAAAAAKAKAEAEAKAKAEAEARAKKQAEERAKASQPKPAPVVQQKSKEEIEREAREAMERARKEAEEKASREAEALRLKIEQERRALEEADEKRREEEAGKRREEEEIKRKADEERRAREEVERRKEEEARRRRDEEERKRREEEERKRKVEDDRRAREEADRRRKEEEEERKRREEEERRARVEAERRRKEEEERRRREEEERRVREEAERRRKEEEERKRREEEERRRKEEEERRRREEAERRAREEAERRAREEAVRKAREDADRRRDEDDRKRREEDERRRGEESERARARREEQERARSEEQARVAAGGDSFANSLLADLESFAQRDEGQRHVREAAEREEKERTAREAEARRRRAEEDRTREAALVTSIPPGGGEAPSQGRATRRLAAIVAADVVGYSRMMGQDEEGTLARLRAVLNDIIRPMVTEHSGHIVKTVGDGLLIEFASVVAAVRWAAESQEKVAESQASAPRDQQIVFRMGINLGDIISDENDVFGDGVNVAARLEGLADNGGICISSTVYDQIRDKVPFKFQDLGNQRFKNISRPVHVYRFKDEREAERPRGPVLQDAASLKPATAKYREPEADEIEVSEDDLRMDEVKRDEQAMTKEARKAARQREKEEKRRLKEEQRRLKAEQEPIKPIKIRRPRKWGKTITLTLLTLVIGALVAVHLAPVPVGDYERAASAALGQPVKIGSARMSLLRGLEIVFSRVSIGDAVRIDKLHAYPYIETLTGDRKMFHSLEIEGATVQQGRLADLLFGSMKLGALRVGDIKATKLTLQGPLNLPTFDADVKIAASGALASVTLKGPDNLVATLTPHGNAFGVEVNADHLTPPFAPDVVLSLFSGKGSATRDGLEITEWSAVALDGDMSGTASIRWGPQWNVEGKLKVRRINAAVFSPALLSEGRIEQGQGNYRMSGPNPAKLYESAHIEGHFDMSKGSLGSVDLSRAIQTQGGQSAGRTVFAELSADGVYDGGTVQLRNINLSAGALSAAAAVDVARSGALSGRIVADMRTQNQTMRQVLNVSGTVKEPVVNGRR